MRQRSILIASLVMMAGFLIAGGLPALAASSPVGTWGAAKAAPGTSAANGAVTEGVSCAKNGECTALVDAGLVKGDLTSSIVTEQGGIWGPLVPIPGLTKIAPADDTAATGLSCPKSGYCLVVGIYAYGTDSDSIGAFTIWESNGKWGTPAKIPGLLKLSTAGLVLPDEVACSSTHTCVISGIYGTGASSNPGFSSFIAEDLYGKWKNAIQVPGLPKASSSDSVSPTGLSCPSQGNCVLGLALPTSRSRLRAGAEASGRPSAGRIG